MIICKSPPSLNPPPPRNKGDIIIEVSSKKPSLHVPSKG